MACLYMAIFLQKSWGCRAFRPSSLQASHFMQKNHLVNPDVFQAARSRSIVEDPDGPTPVLEQETIEAIDPIDIPELREIYNDADLPRPIPHQPWRRGDTAGCETPIDAPWRVAAEDEIYKAVEFVGGRVLDVTWFLTSVLVTIDDQVMPFQDFFKDKGPVIEIKEPGPPVYRDPEDPEPEEIWGDDETFVYERETPEEAADAAQRKYAKYARADNPNSEPHIPDDIDDIPLYRNYETRDEVAALELDEYQQRFDESEQPMSMETINVDTAALSTIADAILEALKPHEDEWDILSRHELILASPNPANDVLETQKQFNEYRGHPVAVETVDPFNSNRTIKGRIVDRNSMDVLLNVQGRLVTIPLNFVKCVRLPPENLVEENYGIEVEEDEILQP